MRRTTCGFVGLATLLVAGAWCRGAVAATAVLGAAADNSLYEVAEEDPALSNGSGQFIFSGTTAMTGARHRALIRFDLSGIPVGSTITGVTLGLFLNQSISGDRDVELHRVTASWGEGTSDASGQEGMGTAAAADDATWFDRFFPTNPWANPGGDFDSTISATTLVSDAFLQYTWSSTGLVSDVQGWLGNPSTNFGWLVLAADEVDVATSKRFGSRENPTATQRPMLTITFTPPAGQGAGAVAESGAPALRMTRGPGSSLNLAWGADACADPDYEVYEGTLGSPASAFPLLCSTGNSTTATIMPTGSGNHFYDVVPRGALLEGSYGTTTGVIQRPPSASACLPQSILSCP